MYSHYQKLKMNPLIGAKQSMEIFTSSETEVQNIFYSTF